MEKIIVTYKLAADWGDEYKIILSFIYDSPEKWLVDFENALVSLVENKKKDWENVSNELTFCGHLFEAHDFCNMFPKKPTYKLPDVYSLDEWFEKNLKETLR